MALLVFFIFLSKAKIRTHDGIRIRQTIQEPPLREIIARIAVHISSANVENYGF